MKPEENMSSLRIACSLLVLLVGCTSCLHRLPNEVLTGIPRAPAAFSSFGGDKPHLREWKEFVFFENAAVQMRIKWREWDCDFAIRGSSIAVLLNEGSRIENTTAHPQYYKIWLLLPADAKAGTILDIKSAASIRATNYSIGETPYSRLKEKELSISGMNGYDIPTLRHHKRTIGTIEILDRTPEQMTVRLKMDIPLKLEMEKSVYNLIIDREVSLKHQDILDQFVNLMRPGAKQDQDKYIDRILKPSLEKSDIDEILRRLGRQPP